MMMGTAGTELILRYPPSEKRQVKIVVQDDQMAQVIFEEVQKAFGIEINSQILRTKSNRYAIKLVAGWPVSFYGLKAKPPTIIDVESLEDNLDIELERNVTANTEKNKMMLRLHKKFKDVAFGVDQKSPLPSVPENDDDQEDLQTQKDPRETTQHKVNLLKNANEEAFKTIVNKIKKGDEDCERVIAGDDFADVNMADAEGWTLIHYAIHYRNKAIAKFLINQIALDAHTKDGFTPLMLCIMRNEFDLFKQMIDHGKVKIDKVTQKGSALHFAIESKASQFLNYLISKGADPFVLNSAGKPAIDLLEDEDLKARILKQKEEEKNFGTLKNKPPSLRGILFKTGNLFRNLKVRYVVVNINQRTLVRYKSRQDVPDKPLEIIPLGEIKKVEETKNKFLLQHGYYYFQVVYNREMLVATKSKAKTQEWVEGIKSAVEYTKMYEEAIRSGQLDLQAIAQLDIPNEEIDMDADRQLPPPGKEPAKQLIVAPQVALKPKVTVNLSNFEIIKFIGRGSFGRVYKVKLKNNGRIYAMKVLNKEVLIAKKQIRYAQSEANILKNANHPFILSLHFSFQTPTNLYMVIDYCPNGDLAIMITRDNYLAEDLTKFFIAELVLAVQHLHEMGVLYRDLKPENILLDNDGHIKLADFGLSRENIGQNDVARSFCGSHIYLSPEMASKKGFTQASDNYGIGLCMYEMLYGQLPFYSEDIDKLHSQIRRDEIKYPTDIRVSGEAKDLMQSLLKKNPKDRLGSRSKEELLNHPFFRDINWKDLIDKKLKPPFKLEDQDEIDLKRRVRINDRDYTDTNMFHMRIKDFTFVRYTELG